MTAVIKYFTTRFLVRRFKNAPMLDYRTAAAQSKRFLVYVPSSVSMRSLSGMLDGVRSLYPDARLDFLIATDCPTDIRNFLSRQSVDLHVIGKEELRFSRIIRKDIVERLQQRNFDVVIDMSAEFDVTFAHAIRQSGAPILITRYRDKEPHVFHNLFVKSATDAQFHENVCRCLAQLKA